MMEAEKGSPKEPPVTLQEEDVEVPAAAAAAAAASEEMDGSDGENIASTYYFNDFQEMKEHMSSPQTRNREDKKQRQVGRPFFVL